MKIAFENNTSGTNLGLYAGTDAEFASGSGGRNYRTPEVPGFRFLSIIELSGKIIFVRHGVGSANSLFTLTVE